MSNPLSGLFAEYRGWVGVLIVQLAGANSRVGPELRVGAGALVMKLMGGASLIAISRLALTSDSESDDPEYSATEGVIRAIRARMGSRILASTIPTKSALCFIGVNSLGLIFHCFFDDTSYCNSRCGFNTSLKPLRLAFMQVSLESS